MLNFSQKIKYDGYQSSFPIIMLNIDDTISLNVSYSHSGSSRQCNCIKCTMCMQIYIWNTNNKNYS